jgi:two-component system LytT family response regulator
MLKAVLLEDNYEHALILESLLKINCKHIEVVGVCHNLTSVKSMIEAKQPDVILSDISLQGEDVFKFFGNENDRFYALIFITAYQDFAIKAVKVHAFDYILKPYNGKDLIELENKLMKLFESKQKIQPLKNKEEEDAVHKDFLTIRLSLRTIKANIKDVVMLNAKQSYTDIYLANGEMITASRNIKYFLAHLPKDRFFRTHKSYVVNMQHFKEMDTSDDYNVLLDFGMKAPISRRVLPQFNAMLKESIG